jgi:Type III restriction enzyme, res subunit
VKNALLAGRMSIPLEYVDVGHVQRALTIDYLPMGADAPLEVRAFEIDATYAHVPRQFGITLCRERGIPYEDCTSIGVAVKFPKTPKEREYQVGPLQLISGAFQTYYDFIFRARTGWGKTIGSLIAAARLGRSTVILVDQENLKDQWVESLVTHFGFKVEDIGIIQGNKCTHEGKAVTIAMVQTLSQRKYDQSVYDYFGTVIVDEVHIIGAPTFSMVLLRFSASYRFGVSATPKRRDALQKLLDYNLGRVRVYVEDEHDPSAVYVAYHGSVYSEYANRAPKIGRFINEVTEDAARNLMLAESIAYLYDTGRDILVLSDRIEHLSHLEALCYYLGIPSEEMGVYAGYSLQYGYDIEPAPARRPEGYQRGVEYTPLSLQLISKRAKKPELERIKTTARIIFATYGKFSKGVDEPRLSGGVDASPRSTAEQVQGRILRKVDGKLRPIWITIGDTASYRSLFALSARIDDYVKNNAVVSTWSLERGKEQCNPKQLKAKTLAEVKRLKFLRVEMNSDGVNTLLTRGQQIRQEQPPVTATTRRARVLPVYPTGFLPRGKSAKS